MAAGFGRAGPAVTYGKKKTVQSPAASKVRPRCPQPALPTLSPREAPPATPARLEGSPAHACTWRSSTSINAIAREARSATVPLSKPKRAASIDEAAMICNEGVRAHIRKVEGLEREESTPCEEG